MQSPPKVGVCIASGATCLCCHLRSMKCFCRTVFKAGTENQIKRTTAIPKRTMFGIAVFLCIFFIPFFCKLISGAYAPRNFLVSVRILHQKINHFSVIFESMSNREIAGIIILDGRYQSDTKTVTA